MLNSTDRTDNLFNKKGRGLHHDPKNIEFKPTKRMQLHLSMPV